MSSPTASPDPKSPYAPDADKSELLAWRAANKTNPFHEKFFLANSFFTNYSR